MWLLILAIHENRHVGQMFFCWYDFEVRNVGTKDSIK